MTEQSLELKAQTSIPEHWSVYLRCTICFGYFREPHTLSCGHTFCKRCLKRLADIAREENPDVRMRRLSLTCPECRHPFPAKPVLLNRLSTCIVLKHLVDLWKRECFMLASSSALTVRSICTQTPKTDLAKGPDEKAHEPEMKSDVDAAKESGSSGDLHEEFTVRMRPLDRYCQAVMQKVSESTEDLEHDLLQESLLSKASEPGGGTGSVLSGLGSAHHLAVAIIGAHHHHYHHHHTTGSSDTSSDSEASSISSNTRGRLTAGRSRGDAGRNSDNEASSLSSVSIPDMFARVSLLPQLSSLAPARLLLLLVWCMYSVVIVNLAQSLLPYIIIFTVFFFLEVLR
ncbi:tripartite motif-containing protein 65 [Plakobranchus ocellatus]|uniref:Tripartite motif-containing protein 65 n=1 Tax=Plakobranchus ocellatus TaxID=259542 RepID=A0AAV4B904_9GAST|nr:tripartite motif-containing protein 65 [Plakobranchus ocellatus]